MQKKKILNFRPFVFTAISLILGIVSGSLFYFEKYLFATIVCFIFALLTVLFVFFTGDGINKKLYFLIAFALLFLLGITTLIGRVNAFDKGNRESHYYSVNGKVIERAQTEYGNRIILDGVRLDEKEIDGFKIAVYVYGDSDLDIGDIVEFYSQVQDNSSVYEGNFSATNIERKVKYSSTVNASDISVVGNKTTIFERVHLFFRNTLESGLGGEEWPTSYALLIGQTEEMDDELLTSYRSSGVAHIFAVSGLHIGFLATVLNWIFNKFNTNKVVKAILITIILLFYSGVCGFSASSIRATIMSAVMLFASIRGRRYDGLSSVGLACTIILLYSPLQLFCVGFQLSFVVVLGIILLSPCLNRLLKFLPTKLASSISVVLSAWVVGIPVQLATFGSFSIFAILANFILIPIVGVIYVFLFVAVVIGGIFGIAGITLFLPKYALMFINLIINSLDYEIFIVGGISMGLFAILYYLALIIPSGILNFHNLTKVIASLLCVAVCILGTTISTINENKSEKAYVIGSKTECSTIIKSQQETIMVVSDSGQVPTLNRYKRISKTQGINKIDKLIFTAGATNDMQIFITRLNQVFSVESVGYFGQTDAEMETIIRKSFGIDVKSYVEGENISKHVDCSFALDGYAVEIEVNEHKVAIFSKFGANYAGYGGLKGDYSLVVAVDYLEQIYGLYNAKEFLSYKNSSTFNNAESSGTVCIYLK